jgi:hypothetical protein
LKTRNALNAPYYQFAVVVVHRSYWKVNMINALASWQLTKKLDMQEKFFLKKWRIEKEYENKVVILQLFFNK